MKLLTVKELADLLKISVQTVYKMAETGAIPAMKVGKQWRFDETAILKWIQDQQSSFHAGP